MAGLFWSPFEEVLNRKMVHVGFARRPPCFKKKQFPVAGEDKNEREAAAEGKDLSAGADSDFYKEPLKNRVEVYNSEELEVELLWKDVPRIQCFVDIHPPWKD